MTELLDLLTWAQQQQAADQNQERLRQVIRVLEAQQQQIQQLSNPTLELVQTGIFLVFFVALAVILGIYIGRLERRLAALENPQNRVNKPTIAP